MHPLVGYGCTRELRRIWANHNLATGGAISWLLPGFKHRSAKGRAHAAHASSGSIALHGTGAVSDGIDAGAATVGACHKDYRTASISDGLRAILGMLETMTLHPNALTGRDVAVVVDSGVTRTAVEDAMAVCAIFNIVTRYTDALAFAMPTPEEFDKAAGMLLKWGYN